MSPLFHDPCINKGNADASHEQQLRFGHHQGTGSDDRAGRALPDMERRAGRAAGRWPSRYTLDRLARSAPLTNKGITDMPKPAARLYDETGRWVALDERHSIRKEHTGAAKAQWVFRFCGDFIASHPTRQASVTAALRWEMERVSRMVS